MRTRLHKDPSPETFILDLNKLQQGDNSEWKKFYELMMHKMKGFVIKTVRTDIHADDVVANAIVDVYVNRYMFHSMDHMIGHTYEFLRYESLNVSKKWRKWIIDDDLIFTIGEYLSDSTEKPMTLHEAEECEIKKSEMLKLVRENSYKLPPMYRRLVDLYLKVENMYDLKEALKQYHFRSSNANQAAVRSFSMLRSLLSSESVKTNEDLLQKYEQVLRSLSPHQREILLAIRTHRPERSDMLEVSGVKGHQLTGALSRMAAKFREVSNDPRLHRSDDAKRATKYLNFFAGKHEQEIEELFDRILNDPEVQRKLNGRFPVKVTSDFIKRASQLKRQGLTWGAIAKEMGTTYKTLQKHINLFPADIQAMKGHNIGNTRLLDTEINIIRKMKGEGRTIQYIADNLGVDPSTISRALNGRTNVMKNAS